MENLCQDRPVLRACHRAEGSRAVGSNHHAEFSGAGEDSKAEELAKLGKLKLVSPDEFGP
jgi:hypothetical protein